MAQDPDKAPDDGVVGMPRVDAGHNRIGPSNKPPARRGRKAVALRAGEHKEQTGAERHAEIIRRAMKRFDRCLSAEADNRKHAVDDLKFKSGEGQWPTDIISERNFDKRPCLTINKLPTFVNQVVNDQRMNRPAININPVGDKSDPEVAKMYRGLIRSIERDSAADIAYDWGFDSAVSCGWGYWRVMREYASPKSFNQVLVIKRVRNTFTVYLDPAHQEPDGSDAKHGFVTEMIPRSEFEDEWPDADPMPWTQGGFGEELREWVSQHEIRIVEYYEIVTEKRRLVRLANWHEGWWDELDEKAKNEADVVDERWADSSKLMWYKLTAKDVLAEEEWPGKWIPIVKCLGNEIDINGKIRMSGLIRNAKSPQMLYNYHRTLSVELSSLQPKAPWIMEEGQVEGHETAWRNANTKSNPYLLYKGTSVGGKVAPPPQRQPFAGAPAGVLAEVQAAAQDFMGVTGLRFDATLGERMYDESGRALRELRERGELGSFHYVDNLARSLRHTGAILVDLIPKVYESKRMTTILREDDTEEQVEINPAAEKPFMEGKNPATGKALKIFNPTFGTYGVTVTIGPSYATKRIEAGESMMDFMRAIAPAAPQVAVNIADLVAKNMDWPGAPEMATRLAKMLPPNLLQPDIKDVPPQVQAMLSQLQQQLQALTNEKMQLTQALTEQQSDRAQRQDKIEKDFEAKLLQIVAEVETKMAATQQKQDDAIMKHVGGPIAELAKGVAELRGAMDKPAANGNGGGPGKAQGVGRLAPDGKYYIRDPGRPGKYMLVH